MNTYINVHCGCHLRLLLLHAEFSAKTKDAQHSCTVHKYNKGNSTATVEDQKKPFTKDNDYLLVVNYLLMKLIMMVYISSMSFFSLLFSTSHFGAAAAAAVAVAAAAFFSFVLLF